MMEREVAKRAARWTRGLSLEEKAVVSAACDRFIHVFLFEPVSDRYLGRLCKFGECPRGKRECLVPGCGETPFNRRIEDFEPYPDILAPAAYATLYRRETGRLRSALDFPGPFSES